MSRISAFPLVRFLLCCAFFHVEGCPPHELKALLRFKSTLEDTAGMLESWKGGDCCTWNGVKCHGTQYGRHVSKVDLLGFKLRSARGEIDSSLFELTHLSYMDLRGNYFHGEIPSQLGNLSSLHHLHLDSDISSCTYDGCNMEDILTSFDLRWLSNLTSLEYLSLNSVHVKDKSWGSIIGSLLHLKYLDLFECFISAPTIPNTLLNLSSLTFLDLSFNSFSNMLTWMGKPSSLTHLDLSSNKLEGTIPSSLGLLIKLTFLSLESNRLRGNIPASLGHLHKLRVLNLGKNQLSGSLPVSFAHLNSLTYLHVTDNNLNGSIPSSLMLPSSLQILYLSSNNMNGTITEVFFQKSLKLEDVDLSHSGLSINISSTWIPSFQLRTLYLRKCQIGGPIPRWISTQFSLGLLDLSTNQLIGNLPSWLWDIDVVQLSNNHLQGSFSPTSGLLRYLDLSMNELSGRLPVDIHVHLSNAEVLLLADNKFEGQTPTSIAKLRNLTFLDMSNNHLTGNVPAILGNLTHLQALNLENNYLEGEIPKELGSLSYLQSLRIGKNSMQGVIPSSLRNL